MGNDGEVLLYRVESSRSGAKLVSRSHGEAKGPVMVIDQFDTELESLVLFAQAHGTLRGWDLRGPKDAWSLPIPPSLGVPLSMATERLSVTVGTAGERCFGILGGDKMDFEVARSHPTVY
eukprot:symbB.v1.2.017979.t1/scaffold1402.1/size121251/8